MKEIFTKLTGIRRVFALTLLLLALTSTADMYSIEIPKIPKLNLVGGDDSYDLSWYPDGRIWLPVAANGTREFLLPVFIDNRWFSYVTAGGGSNGQDTIYYVADPIKSFQFKILYNQEALRAVGVQTSGPRHDPEGLSNSPYALDYEPLANGFNIDWADSNDFSYLTYIFDSPIAGDRQKGRAIRITGSSDKALPNTNLNSAEYKVLLYVRFRIVPQSQTDVGSSGNSPLYISNDTIKYNDLNVTREAPFVKYRPYNTGPLGAENQFKDPPSPPVKWGDKNGLMTGLSGISNRDGYTLSTQPPNNTMYGNIYVRFFSAMPTFGFKTSRAIDPPDAVRLVDPNNLSMYEIRTPITVDNVVGAPEVARREVEVFDGTPSTRLNDINIESDSPWLEFQTVTKAGLSKSPNPIPSATRKGYINWVDNGILGPQGYDDELGKKTALDGKIYLEVRCDPSKLTNGGAGTEKEGIYVGYLTFKSQFADVSPVRLKVTFIYFKTPVEGRRANTAAGIKLKISNSKQGTTESTQIIFGTGPRATKNVDSLYGEYAYEYCNFCTDPGTFGARLFPRKPDGTDLYEFGLGDFCKNDENPRSSSRDIRNEADSLESIIYNIKFNAGGDPNYPVTLLWDTQDFPDGANLFIKDDLNGKLFPAVDMRNATVLGQYLRSFIIQDPKIDKFSIEYTPSKVIEYVDERGEPIIQKGWNLLSLPVKSTNTTWNNVYPNAINRPYYFYLGGYQEDQVLRAGVGYFIKYGAKIDKTFAGSVISEISEASNNTYKMWPGDAGKGGWNSIGSLSYPISINNIDFDKFGSNTPDKNYTMKFGVWGYNTNNGYYEVSEIRPGLGYFIKVNVDGYLKLTGPFRKKDNMDISRLEKETVYNQSTAITVADNGQSKSTVYVSKNSDLEIANFEMPPVPMPSLFDVRFSTGNNVDNSSVSVIKLQGAMYPVSLTVTNAKDNYTFIDALTGKVFGTVLKGTNGNIVINEKLSNNIKVVATEGGDNSFELSTYPNPVVSDVNFNYSLPSSELVNISIYNQVGGLVANVVNEYKKAGSNVANFDASNLNSGNYIVKFNAGAINATRKLTIVK